MANVFASFVLTLLLLNYYIGSISSVSILSNCPGYTHLYKWNVSWLKTHGSYIQALPSTFSSNYLIFNLSTEGRGHLRLTHWDYDFLGIVNFTWWEFVFDVNTRYKMRIRWIGEKNSFDEIDFYNNGIDLTHGISIPFWIYWDINGNISMGAGTQILQNIYVTRNYLDYYGNYSIKYLWIGGYRNDATWYLWNDCTFSPTLEPTIYPTSDPTLEPTIYPSIYPTFNPTPNEGAVNPQQTSNNTMFEGGNINDKNRNNSDAMIIVIVSILCIVIIIAIFIYFYMRYKRRKNKVDTDKLHSIRSMSAESAHSTISQVSITNKIEMQTVQSMEQQITTTMTPNGDTPLIPNQMFVNGENDIETMESPELPDEHNNDDDDDEEENDDDIYLPSNGIVTEGGGHKQQDQEQSDDDEIYLAPQNHVDTDDGDDNHDELYVDNGETTKGMPTDNGSNDKSN